MTKKKILFTGITCRNSDYIHTPLIEIVDADVDGELQEAIEDLKDDDILLFTSRFAAIYWKRMLLKTEHDWNNSRIVSIGKTTTTTLQAMGATGIEECRKDDSYGVIDHFRMTDNHHRVVFPRSDLALDIIPNGLREMGFKVKTIVAYRNIMPQNPVQVDLSTIRKIIFTSPSTIDNFIRIYGELPRDMEYETRGAITQAHLEKQLSQNHQDK